MSEAPQNDKAAEQKPDAATATAEKPAPPPEPPFTTDHLQSSTARFTHKAWYIYYNNRKVMQFNGLPPREEA